MIKISNVIVSGNTLYRVRIGPFTDTKLSEGHGYTSLDKAIVQSCDVFFYEISKKLGIDKIAKVAKDFGLGQTFDISMPNQKKGIVPSKKWKKTTLGESWYAGETLISGIGQGFVLTNLGF